MADFSDIETIAVLGGGAWGTALAQVAAQAGRKTLLWAREAEVVESINQTHENQMFLPGVSLSPALKATGDLADLAAADAILLVAPAQHTRAMMGDLLAALPADNRAPLVICSKGIEIETGQLLTGVLAECAPGHPLAALSGPTFAREVASGLPTAVTLACADEALGTALAESIGSPTFRPYLSDDLTGAEIGGAVKNVYAIATGIVEGKKLGDNARAALTARAMAEMSRLATALGAQAGLPSAKPETLMGLSGLGDLILTCSSPQSRNMSLGLALGQGQSLEEIMAARNSVAEGVTTAKALAALTGKLGIDMPIAQTVHAIVNQGADINQAIAGLLARPFTSETD